MQIITETLNLICSILIYETHISSSENHIWLATDPGRNSEGKGLASEVLSIKMSATEFVSY